MSIVAFSQHCIYHCLPDMERVRVDAPLWDQSTFYGRFRHFFWMTNPLNGLHSEAELLKAKNLVQQYRAGEEPNGTTDEQVRDATIYYSIVNTG